MRFLLKHYDQWRERPLAYLAPKRNASVRNFSLRMPILYQKSATICKNYLPVYLTGMVGLSHAKFAKSTKFLGMPSAGLDIYHIEAN